MCMHPSLKDAPQLSIFAYVSALRLSKLMKHLGKKIVTESHYLARPGRNNKIVRQPHKKRKITVLLITFECETK